jgi:hypothetical protein
LTICLSTRLRKSAEKRSISARKFVSLLLK